ncbi:hypothetical protein D3C76_890920 [compost metagenome]
MLLDQAEHPLVAFRAMGRIHRGHFRGVAEDRRAGVHGVVHEHDVVGPGQNVDHAGEVIGERVADHDAVQLLLGRAQPAVLVGFGLVQRIGHVAAAADLGRLVQGHRFKR